MTAWIVMMLVMTGEDAVAEEFAKILGWTGIAAHDVAKKAGVEAEKKVQERQSGGYSVDNEAPEDEQSGPDRT